MNVTTLFRGLAALTAAVVALAILPAAGTAADWSPEEGYKSLFNGKDLSGWYYGKAKDDLAGKTETPDGRFKVVDGILTAAEGKGIKDLTTLAEFNKSFHLKLEFRAAAKADSGVYVRGPQLQVRDFIRRGEQKALEKVFKNDDWNELDITVRNDVITAAVNGKTLAATDALTVTYKDGKPEVSLNGQAVELQSVEVKKGATAVCKLNGVQFDANYKPGTKGGVGVQAETGKFEFRRIRVKELD